MKYICGICGYVYDDDKEKVRFSELPEDWHCPLCGAPKSAFAPEKAVTETPKKHEEHETKDEQYTKLTNAQISAILTNLALGCEKQYNREEAKLFTEIADYYKQRIPEEEKATVNELEKLVANDISDIYPEVKETAERNADRGALRVCVWGEKVSRMILALLERYKKEGEKMLENTEIWVCTVCGFIYIGDKAPELCPVCKVPAWKFEKIERRHKI